jgi:site-specific recombinase XerD
MALREKGLKRSRKTGQEMLGHATISITLDFYSHVTPMIQERTAQAMEVAIV